MADRPTYGDYVGYESSLDAAIVNDEDLVAIWDGSSYEINASAYDNGKKTALFFATFTGTHSGDGGPIPPTNKTTNSQYVYALKMNDEGKIESMTKIWNSSWALRELGWM